MTQNNDKTLEKVNGGLDIITGPNEPGVPGARVHQDSLACEHYEEIPRALTKGHCNCCRYMSFSPAYMDINNPGAYKCRYGR